MLDVLIFMFQRRHMRRLNDRTVTTGTGGVAQGIICMRCTGKPYLGRFGQICQVVEAKTSQHVIRGVAS
jgi:hypothetical protein